METMTVKNLYDSFIRMTPAEQHNFISRINDYENQTVAYAADGCPLTRIQYRERVHVGIAQYAKRHNKSLEELCEETGHKYAEL